MGHRKNYTLYSDNPLPNKGPTMFKYKYNYAFDKKNPTTQIIISPAASTWIKAFAPSILLSVGVVLIPLVAERFVSENVYKDQNPEPNPES